MGDKLPESIINTTAAKEHVDEEEHCIGVVKEKGRSIIETLHLKNPKPMINLKFILLPCGLLNTPSSWVSQANGA